MTVSLSLYDRSALLSHELRDVIGAASALPGGARCLPAAKRLGAGPGPRCRTGPLVGVTHPGLHLIEEPGHLRRILGENACRESVFYPVGLLERLGQTTHLADRDKRHK